MITIRINPDHPRLLGQDLSKVRFVIGPTGGSVFYPTVLPAGYAQSPASIGEAGTSPKRLEVSGSRPIMIEDEDFAFLGSTRGDALLANRAKSSLVQLMRQGYIIVEMNGAEQTPEDVATAGA